MQVNKLRNFLAQASRHVAEGEALLAHQRALIARMQRAELGTGAAESFLEQLKEMQAHHVADRDRLERELARQSVW